MHSGKLRIKVCGMKYPENIEAVAALSPDFMGFICYKGSQRYIDQLPPDVLELLDETIVRTGVFVNEEVDLVIEMQKKYSFGALQLHGHESPEDCARLAGETGAAIIKAFSISDNFDFDQLEPYNNATGLFLFDTPTANYGGSGKQFNWDVLNRYQLKKPYFLSGGIGPEDIDQVLAIEDPRLFAVDVNSRFEKGPGLKDEQKLNYFIKRLQEKN